MSIHASVPPFDDSGLSREPMVPRRPARQLDMAAHGMAEKLPAGGGWIVTGIHERVEPISDAIIYARGSVFASTVDIAVVPSKAAEDAFFAEIRAAGDDRPITYDPILIASRAAAAEAERISGLVPPDLAPATAEVAPAEVPPAKVARPVDPERRSRKSARMAARRARRNAQHAALLEMIEAIPPIGGIIIVQSMRATQHVFDVIARVRPELINPGFIVVVAAPRPENEERELNALPILFRCGLPIFWSPGVAVARERFEARAKAMAERIERDRREAEARIAEEAAEQAARLEARIAEKIAQSAADEVAAAARAKFQKRPAFGAPVPWFVDWLFGRAGSRRRSAPASAR